jgi:membrane protease YdiL (CAAX protease family)
MAGLLLLTGSLWAPMLLHAVLDVNSGYLAHKTLQPAPVDPS